MRTPQAFGAKGDGLTDDSAALRAWALAGGGEIPLGSAYLFDGPIRYGSGFRMSGGGRLRYRRGWASGYALCASTWAPRHSKGMTTTGDVVIDGSQGLAIEFVGAAADPKYPRKGLGITYVDGATVDKLNIRGGSAPPECNLFAGEVRGARNVRITGGHYANRSGRRGSDSWHVSDWAENVVFNEVNFDGFDDALGVTDENAQHGPGTFFRRILVTGSILRTIGYSGLKLLLDAKSSGAVIEDLAIRHSRISVTLAQPGAGVPIIARAEKGAGGALRGLIRGVSIYKGRIEVKVPAGGLVAGPLIQLEGIEDFRLEGTEIEHFSRVLVDARDCPGLVIDPASVRAIARVPTPSRPRPLVDLVDCPGARIGTAKLAPAYPGQAIA